MTQTSTTPHFDALLNRAQATSAARFAEREAKANTDAADKKTRETKIENLARAKGREVLGALFDEIATGPVTHDRYSCGIALLNGGRHAPIFHLCDPDFHSVNKATCYIESGRNDVPNMVLPAPQKAVDAFFLEVCERRSQEREQAIANVITEMWMERDESAEAIAEYFLQNDSPDARPEIEAALADIQNDRAETERKATEQAEAQRREWPAEPITVYELISQIQVVSDTGIYEGISTHYTLKSEPDAQGWWTVYVNGCERRVKLPALKEVREMHVNNWNDGNAAVAIRSRITLNGHSVWVHPHWVPF